MHPKTHKTAVVLIPPEEVWAPIQRIRREHDKQFRRWMPHITLVYPFRPAGQFDSLLSELARACKTTEPFELELAEFRWFAHSKTRFTIWLAPEPAEAIRKLQACIQPVVPDCDDVTRFAGGFTPHLSVGQAESRRDLKELVGSLQSAWQPMGFPAMEIGLISRGNPPDDIFSLVHTMKLGRTN